MPSIVIVGTEGAGKTVFVTCLAKYVQQGDKGVILDPQNAKTQIYIENVWAKLQSGDWPPSTPPGELPLLDWHLIVPNCASLDIRLFDPPGHDIRRLMANGAALSEIPPELAPLANSIFAADLVILLVNLADVLGEPNDERRIVSELVVKFILDVIDRRDGPKHAALVFTQADQYCELISASQELASVARQHLPLVHQTLGLRPWCELFAVAAVFHTQTKIENGIARRVPAPGFQPYGFDPLLFWIKSRAKELHDKARWKKFWKEIAPVIYTIIVAVVFYFFMLPLASNVVRDVKQWWSTTSPDGTIVSSTLKYEYVGIFDYDVIATGTVTNLGGGGIVTVHAGLISGSQSWTDESQFDVPKGGAVPFAFRFKAYNTGNAFCCLTTKKNDLSKRDKYQPVP